MSTFDEQYPNARGREDQPGWPSGVRPISVDGLGYLGVGDDGKLYWDGKQLATTVRLRSFELILASMAALGTFGVFVVEVGRSLKWWS